MLTKNTAGQKVRVFAFDATTNLPKTGDAANITASLSKDFGAFADLTDTSATEEDSTKAKGYYLFDISQTETNADDIAIAGRSTTANIVVVGAPARIHTVPANFFADVYGRLGAPAGASVSADVAAIKSDTGTILTAVDTEVAAIKAKTDNLPAAPAAVSDIPTAIQNADATLIRGVSNVEGTADPTSLCGIVLATLESSISGTTWTIRKTGGTTFTTKTITTDAAAVPITGVT